MSDQRMAQDFWAKVDTSGGPDACWLWVGSRNRGGYGVHRPHRARRYMAHRLAWHLTNGTIPEGLFACHHCDNPPCVNPSHLFLGTAADNGHDMAVKGRSLYGERANGARLTAANVIAIRSLYGTIPASELAARYGISSRHLRDVVRGRRWAHVEAQAGTSRWARRGADHYATRLSDDEVRTIRAEYMYGDARRLAARYGVSRSLITGIVRGDLRRERAAPFVLAGLAAGIVLLAAVAG